MRSLVLVLGLVVCGAGLSAEEALQTPDAVNDAYWKIATKFFESKRGKELLEKETRAQVEGHNENVEAQKKERTKSNQRGPERRFYMPTPQRDDKTRHRKRVFCRL